MRTVIDVPDEVIATLDRVSGKEKRSRAALIREALAEYARVKTRAPAEAAFGLWQDKTIDGIAYQDALREEWTTR